MKVSIIIPCYNLGQYLEQAIKSVMNQTFTDWELIVIDDGSTDEDTKNVLANINYPKTKLIRTKNQGLPVARNTAIREAQGEYIACLDADDQYAPTFLEKTVAILDQDKAHRVGIVTTWIQTYGVKEELWKTAEYDPILLATRNVLHVASLFRRECWSKVSGYSESLKIGYQDWDFWIKIVAAGYAWECIEEPLFYYQVREKSMVYFSNQKRPQLFKAIVKNNQNFYQDNLQKILARFFAISEAYEVATQKLVVEAGRVQIKDEYIKELSLSQKTLKSRIKQKNLYIKDLELSRSELEKRIQVKDNYIKDHLKKN